MYATKEKLLCIFNCNIELILLNFSVVAASETMTQYLNSSFFNPQPQGISFYNFSQITLRTS